MQQFIQRQRSNIAKRAMHARRRLAATATGLTGMVAAGHAAASSTLSSGFSTEVTAQKPELLVIAGLVLGVCAIVFILSKAKRSSGG